MPRLHLALGGGGRGFEPVPDQDDDRRRDRELERGQLRRPPRGPSVCPRQEPDLFSGERSEDPHDRCPAAPNAVRPAQWLVMAVHLADGLRKRLQP